MTKLRFSIYFTLVTLFWGGSFLGIHYAIQGFHPHFAAWLRILIGFVIFLFILSIRGRRLQKTKYWKQSLFFGLFNMAVPWIFLFWGEKYIPPALAAIINSTVPIFVAVLTPFLTPLDFLSWGKKIGALFGFLGVAVIFYPEIRFQESNDYLWGLVAIVCMSVAYAIGILGVRKYSAQVSNDQSLFYNFLGSAIFMGVFNLLLVENWVLPEFTYKSALAVLYLGVFSTAIALILFFDMIKKVGTVQASATTYVSPLVAIFLDMMILGQGLKTNQILGGGFILLALLMINSKLWKRRLASSKI